MPTKAIPPSMRRLLIPIAALIAVLAVPAGASAYTLGVSDQQASTFTNQLFGPLHFTAARYITPYDVMDSPADKARFDEWYNAAVTANQKVLVSFEHSHHSNTLAREAPTVAAFTRAIKKFKAAYPKVKEISPWNEANRCQRSVVGSIQGQPVCHKPKLVAQYYMAARQVFTGRTIVGVDLLDQKDVNPTLKFLRSFLRYAKPTPKVIGLHNYSDTNRFSSTRTERILAAFRGKVWLTETGGIVTFGDGFPFKGGEQRARKALGCMFSLAKSNIRIQRLYVYQFNPAADPPHATFDAGLINPDGTPRPGYAVVKSRKARSCHK
jgi:hypothetical protein